MTSPPEHDPWRHRATGMHCATCMWFVAKWPEAMEIEGDTVTAAGRIVGRCRRHAPTMTGYPVVFHTDWCGDHKLNENAR